MIVGQFHIMCVAVFPAEADSVLIVHTDAELSSPIASQRFEVVAGRNPQLIERPHAMQ
jgi:hypothetical protein